jgi:putative FmdB family regulatory protein
VSCPKPLNLGIHEEQNDRRNFEGGEAMPIYEFRCVGCRELFEILLRPGETMEGVCCPHCGTEGGERVLSKVTYAIGSDSGSHAQTTTRSCAGGSCGTITLPGHSH